MEFSVQDKLKLKVNNVINMNCSITELRVVNYLKIL